MPQPHPALRVPVQGDGAGSGDWAGVHWVDGIPILHAEAAQLLSLIGGDATSDLEALSYDAMRHVARYLPHVAVPDTLGLRLAEVLAKHAPADAGLAVDAGCSIGPHIRALRAVSEHVVGFDGNLAALRVAAAHLSGNAVQRPIRIEGHRFAWGEPVALPPCPGVTVVCADLLDPPLFPEVADIAIAMNVIDNVIEPVGLLGQLDAILKPGGLLIISSPFAWQDVYTKPENQLGGGTVPGFQQLGSEAAITQLLKGELPFLTHLDYAILETDDIPWQLREHARATYTYDVHLIAARKRRRS
ncbi:MAG: SAM-dependent methyltransferase [Myxococcota bacterium]|jgi:SAM-dependent methyltransferase